MHLTTKVVRRAPQGISDLLEAEGRFVYRRPRSVIVVSLLFALLWTVLFFALFEQELDRDKLFTPENSRAFDDQEYVEALYGEPDLEVNSPCGFVAAVAVIAVPRSLPGAPAVLFYLVQGDSY